MKHLSILAVLFCCAQGAIKVKHVAKETARIGDNVTLQCQLMTSELHVIQITWRKESGKFNGTVATTSKVYGQKLLGYYSNRTKYSGSNTFNVSAITISSVTPEDEGCFKCIFNLFPLGASTGTICLEVYEANLLEPNLKVYEIAHHDSLGKLYNVTCSASGKPAPNVTWILPNNLNITPEMYINVDLNESETVISNFNLPISSIRNMRVSLICVVNHPGFSSEKRLSTVLGGARNTGTDFKLPPFATLTIIVSGMTFVILIGIAWIICLCNSKTYKASSNTSKRTLLS
ncbi:OX-2 membrane glycoprotein-like [Eleutherodactylus coqui]|uniref:OX-2 membrane glycoprotein-like n=1 Tax=Eleutherodactylus coqui TaxID=57060 RepID=UPI00346348CA